MLIGAGLVRHCLFDENLASRVLLHELFELQAQYVARAAVIDALIALKQNFYALRHQALGVRKVVVQGAFGILLERV